MKKFISLSQFAYLLSTITGSSFAQAISETEPKLNKKSRVTGLPIPFAKVVNCRNLNLQLNYNYENQVNNKSLKEGIEPEFEATAHAWAKRVSGALASHKDYNTIGLDILSLDVTKLYMPYVKNRVDSQTFIADGKEIAKDILNDFFPPKGNYENQPQEKKVLVEYMKLTSIKEFSYNGTEYKIVG